MRSLDRDAVDEDAVQVEAVIEEAYAPRVISAQNAFIMRSMMREVVQRGTAVRAKVLGRNDIAGIRSMPGSAALTTRS